MRIVQLLLEDAPWYEKKSRRLDELTLAGTHAVTVLERKGEVIAGTTGAFPARALADAVTANNADVLHIYGPPALPPEILRGLMIPYVAAGAPRQTAIPWQRAAPPAARISPLDDPVIPEAVGEEYSGGFDPGAPRPRDGRWNLGSCLPDRARVRFICQATLMRIARFREDIDWLIFDEPPSPAELAEVDVWVDPAVEPLDFDGFVAEALTAGKPVVASRTAINQQRLERGESGYLVPPDDPNELAHAALSALFRPDLTEPKQAHARDTAGRFDPAHRAERLSSLYERVTR